MLDSVDRLTEGAPVFHAVPGPTPHKLETPLACIINRVLKVLTQKGALIEDAPESLYPTDTDHDPALTPLDTAASTYGPLGGRCSFIRLVAVAARRSVG